ncbi:hypothetical protein KI387_042528, partial [Taxus chinensis]
IVSMPSMSTKLSTYICRKKSPVKEKMLEVEAPRQPISKEESPEEEDKAKSPYQEPPLRK